METKLTQPKNETVVASSDWLDIGSRWKEIAHRLDRATGKPKGKRVVYVVQLFKRCDGEPMVRYSRQKHGSQRCWRDPISLFKTRYAQMSNAEATGEVRSGE